MHLFHWRAEEHLVCGHDGGVTRDGEVRGGENIDRRHSDGNILDPVVVGGSAGAPREAEVHVSRQRIGIDDSVAAVDTAVQIEHNARPSGAVRRDIHFDSMPAAVIEEGDGRAAGHTHAG